MLMESLVLKAVTLIKPNLNIDGRTLGKKSLLMSEYDFHQVRIPFEGWFFPSVKLIMKISCISPLVELLFVTALFSSLQ